MLETATYSKWWATLPWETINVFCVGLLAAFIFNDLLDRESWLRVLYRKWRSVYVIETFNIVNPYNPTRLTVKAIIRFKKPLKATQVNVFITPLYGKESGIRTLLFTRKLNCPRKDEKVSLILGSIMVQEPGWTPRHSIWGEETGPETLPSHANPIVQGSRNLIEIEINGQSQSVRIDRVDLKNSNGDGFQIFTEEDAMEVLERK